MKVFYSCTTNDICISDLFCLYFLLSHECISNLSQQLCANQFVYGSDMQWGKLGFPPEGEDETTLKVSTPPFPLQQIRNSGFPI